MATRAITALNGKIPSTLLTTVGTDAYGRPARLRTDAAASWERMRAAGMPMDVSDTYRPLDRQWDYWRDPPNSAGLASYPGRSWHGEGLAVDARGACLTWLEAHGAEHGWRRTIAAEPWHWEYDPDRDQHRTDPAPEDDMTPEQAAALNEVRGNTQNVLNGVKALLSQLAPIATHAKAAHAAGDLTVAATENITNGILALLGRAPGTVDAAAIVDLLDDDLAHAVADEIDRRARERLA